MFENSCVSVCPKAYRADRKEFRCQKKNEYSFYWIFPSRAGCKDKCGVDHIKADCSCKYECLRQGNCCDDFEKECKDEFLKENCKLCHNCMDGRCAKCKVNSEQNKLDEGICQCKKGYDYDIINDECKKNKPKHDSLDDKSHEKSDSNILDKARDNEIHNKTNSTNNSNDMNDNSTKFICNNNQYNQSNIEKEKTNIMDLNIENKNNTHLNVVNSNITTNVTCDIHKVDQIKNDTQNINIRSDNITQQINKDCKIIPRQIKKQKKLNSKKNITETQIVQDCSSNNTTRSTKNYNNSLIYSDNKTEIQKNKTCSLTENLPEVDKNLAEELLKSFKNVFSMQNPENKNQILNLYMNGNISINVLTGNTNPQLITQNVYNKDSYNKINHDVKNFDSGNKLINIPQNINKTQTLRFKDVMSNPEKKSYSLENIKFPKKIYLKTGIENKQIIK